MIDIVLITTLSRPELLRQTVSSLSENATTRGYRLVIVIDGYERYDMQDFIGVNELIADSGAQNIILNCRRLGASASRNIGAGSIPKYRRGDYVLFLDDDVYCCPGWDRSLLDCYNRAHSTISQLPYGQIGWMREKANRIISGYSHPFNNCEPRAGWSEPLVISSVAMMMPWAIFDEVGPWDEPGGRGASEDYAMCMRARDKGYGFAVTQEQCIIHCGITSNDGVPIVGKSELLAQNQRLIQYYGLHGKVTQAL
jgi:GT2 family glycosyltransferase